jgi:hypothetical protein
MQCIEAELVIVVRPCRMRHHLEYYIRTSPDGMILTSAREVLKMEDRQASRSLPFSAYSLPKEEVSRLGSRAETKLAGPADALLLL